MSQAELGLLIEFCVPIQKWRPERREEIRFREREAEKLLKEQQRPVIQLVGSNKRIVVTGGAGTGKTLIALELAVRAADAGMRVALLCFNQQIGDWLERRARSLSSSPRLIAGRALKVMARMADVSIPDRPTKDYWDLDLPNAIQERLTAPERASAVSFDFVIVDEAQDLLGRTAVWDCIEMLMDGGLEGGRFAIFGDFQNQVLGEREPMSRKLATVIERARPVQWRLSDNCRNYEIVGRMALRLGGLREDVYDRYLRTGGGQSCYDISFYSWDTEQDERVRTVLRELAEKGYRASEITLLSFCSPEQSSGERLRGMGLALRQSWQGGNSTVYTSISAFKGMENKAIVITDVDVRDTDLNRNLMYTGITRATDLVRVMCSSECTGVLSKWLDEET
jgi:ATP:corrinoid adenosyltransferase